MPIVPMFGVGFYSKSPNVTRQQRTNLYYEPQKDNDKSPAVLYGTPGLTLAYEMTPDSPSRGMLAAPQPGVVGDWLYTVHSNKIYTISPAGVTWLVGTIGTTDGPVSIAWNGLQVLFVDGVDGWIFTPGVSALAKVRDIDSDFPVRPTSVTFLGSYFIVSEGGSGRFWWSAPLNGNSWDALDFATAETSPDNLVSVWSDFGEIVLLGQRTIEMWGPDSTTTWARMGGAALEWGCASAQSVAKFNTGLIFLASNRLGEARVVSVQGYNASPVDTPEVSHAINEQADLSTVTAFSYMVDGHPFYQLNLDAKSYLYDGLSDVWSIVSSGTEGARHYAERRASLSEKPYVSDYRNGNIYLMDKDVYTDNGETIVREVVSRHVFTNYDRRTVWSLQVDFEEGTGLIDGQGDDPQVMLQISKDGGHTWGNELWQTLGAMGNYATRVIWRRLGIARDWLFKLRVTDPVKVVIIGAGIEVE